MSDGIWIYSGLIFLGWCILMGTWSDDYECKTLVVVRKLKRKNRFKRIKGNKS